MNLKEAEMDPFYIADINGSSVVIHFYNSPLQP